jgi:hypothetical protein
VSLAVCARGCALQAEAEHAAELQRCVDLQACCNTRVHSCWGACRRVHSLGMGPPRAQAQLQAREAEIAALTAEARRAGGGGGGGGGAGEDGASRLPRAHACAAAIPA